MACSVLQSRRTHISSYDLKLAVASRLQAQAKPRRQQTTCRMIVCQALVTSACVQPIQCHLIFLGRLAAELSLVLSSTLRPCCASQRASCPEST